MLCVIYLMSLSPNARSAVCSAPGAIPAYPFPDSKSSWLPVRFQLWAVHSKKIGRQGKETGSYFFLPCQPQSQSGSSSDWLQSPLSFCTQTQPLQTPPRHQQQLVVTLSSSECPRTPTRA